MSEIEAVLFKNEVCGGSEDHGPIRLVKAGEARRTGGQPYDPNRNTVWFTRRQADWLADQLGVPVEEA